MSDRSLNNSTKKSALLAYSWWDILMTIIFSRKFLLIISLCQKLILILVSTSKKSSKKIDPTKHSNCLRFSMQELFSFWAKSYISDTRFSFGTLEYQNKPGLKKILLVVLTVRISFLHQCSRHWDFANLINSCQNVWI